MGRGSWSRPSECKGHRGRGPEPRGGRAPGSHGRGLAVSLKSREAVRHSSEGRFGVCGGERERQTVSCPGGGSVGGWGEATPFWTGVGCRWARGGRGQGQFPGPDGGQQAEWSPPCVGVPGRLQQRPLAATPATETWGPTASPGGWSPFSRVARPLPTSADFHVHGRPLRLGYTTHTHRTTHTHILHHTHPYTLCISHTRIHSASHTLHDACTQHNINTPTPSAVIFLNK